ncbi:MAG: DNA internalization-related competence protein ComEC/Rec2 [Gammaproteobacteria bacterium]|nr:DNA internalization-related competence protein ComEC/Rec2 [Gammaproteobacteria bacterium]
MNSIHAFSWITLHVPGILITGHMQWYQAIILSVVILFSFLPKGMPMRFLGVIVCIPLLYHPSAVDLGHARLVFMNVGQGLSILIKTKHHLLVYDTGPKFFTGGDVAQSIIIPYLYYHGWKNIDGLLVSHGDADHSGGAKTLREQFTIPLVWTSDLKRVPKAMRCERGQEWHWDGVDFKILYPDSAVKFHGNNRSCVLKMSIGETSALLVGDIEVEAENYLIDHLSDELSTDVLSVPHHGSKTSSSENFLNATHPRYAVFSYGFLNRFHFPHSVVVQRYANHHIQTRTTENGPVSIDMTATGLTIFPEP